MKWKRFAEAAERAIRRRQIDILRPDPPGERDGAAPQPDPRLHPGSYRVARAFAAARLRADLRFRAPAGAAAFAPGN
jgi:hypothetical protein